MKIEYDEYYENITKAKVKSTEGYRLETYHCTEGPLTGYGHKMLDGEVAPTTKKGWEALFGKGFQHSKARCVRISR